MQKYRLKIARSALNSVIKSTLLPLYPNSGAYVLFHFRDEGIDFIIYDNSKNDPYRAIYEGQALPKYLLPFLHEEISSTEEKTINKVTSYPQIGSDEVGFGDFFGPLVVVSAYINHDDVPPLLKYGVTDSKKLDDTRILMIGEELKTKIKHVKNIVDNPKYNELISRGYNMNKIKAMLHHNVLVKLAKATNYEGELYVDRFTSNKRFFDYTKEMERANIVSVANGEASAQSIATASVLARYYFLLEMAILNKRYATRLPLGAGKMVDDFAINFLKEKGRSALLAITKHNFRNFKDLAEV